MRAVKYMIDKETEGVIINVTSNQGVYTLRDYSAYGSVKAAFNELTKHMALELAE